MALLKRAGLVESTRGAHGGYRLARDPAEVHMDEVILALEGAVAPMSCFVDDRDEGGRVLCSHVADDQGGCATRLLWMRVQGGVMEKLHQTSLSELVAFAGGTVVPAPQPAHHRHPLATNRRPWPTSRSRTCTSAPATRRSCAGWTSRSARARSTPSWAPTARASPRWPT